MSALSAAAEDYLRLRRSLGHELAEAHVLPNSEALHAATEAYGPDGVYGHYLSYMLVVLPLAWLAFSSLFGKGQGQRSQAA